MNILLTTLHSKYSHASLALPYLAAVCGDLPDVSCSVKEFTINEPRDLTLRLIMAEQADLVAFSCYIWNIEKTLRIISDIKKVDPGIRIVLGGPETSFNAFELMHENQAIDFIIKGEGEAAFRQLVETLLASDPDVFPGVALEEIPNLYFRDHDRNEIAVGPHTSRSIPLDSIPSPFRASLVDMGKPLLYYETSRGCPFSCAFCLSSVEGQVRSYSMERIHADLEFLMERGVPQIKLVDRTFNFDIQRAMDIWQFILEHNRCSHFHFEIAADLLTDAAIDMLRSVPEKMFRFEIGVQSASRKTLESINRRSDLGRLFYMIRRLRAETNIELHLDLIAGLPQERLPDFLGSLQSVADLKPHMIQVEPLKVLKGSPMREVARRHDYQFSSTPPYTILKNPWLSYPDICRIETIGRLLDLFHNDGGFAAALRCLGRFRSFSELFDLMAREVSVESLTGRSQRRLYEFFARLAEPFVPGDSRAELLDALFFDYCCCEMPTMGKLPLFAGNQERCAWPGKAELPAGVSFPEGSRVRQFRYRFDRDYRCEPWSEGPTEVTFVYGSGPGQGLSVVVV